MAYRFANQSEVKELEAWCMDILHAVQDLSEAGTKGSLHKTVISVLIWTTILFCKKIRKVCWTIQNKSKRFLLKDLKPY